MASFTIGNYVCELPSFTSARVIRICFTFPQLEALSYSELKKQEINMYGESMMQGTGFMWGWGWGGMFFGPLVMAGILILAVIGVIAILKGPNGAGE